MWQDNLRAYGGRLIKTVSNPIIWGAIAISGVGLWVTSTQWGQEKLRHGRVFFMGSLASGIGLGLLVPLLLPLETVAATNAAPAAATAAPEPRSRSAINKTFEPAQGVESASVFIGQ